VKRKTMSADEAEAIGFSALAFLAEDLTRLAAFLGASGLGPADLKAGSRDPQVLAGVLDHVRSDESMLLVFTSDKRVANEAVEMAHAVLSGRADEIQST